MVGVGTGKMRRLERRWELGESEKEGEQEEGASFYKRMMNDNSTGNKTKHPSCCQSNAARTLEGTGTRQCLAL